jgi:hypothetical protein
MTSSQISGEIKAANDDELRCFKQREDPGITLMLDIRLSTGDRIALPYAYLVSIEYELVSGLLLQFTSHSVLVQGRNLDRLYDGFLKQLIEWIAEEDPMYDTLPDEATFINDIKVEMAAAGTEEEPADAR